MIVENDFNRRREDIEEAYKLLLFILSVETHRYKPLQNTDSGTTFIVTQEMQCILKAQFLIILYNMVESTVCECLNSIYDTIFDEGLEFVKLSPKMKNMWRNYLQRKHLPDANKTDSELKHMPIHFEELAINISGSLDFRKIIDVFDKHGCTLDDSKRDDISESFLIVKNKRNLLAHGNISFSTCGSNYLLSNLDNYRNHIVSYMDDVVKKTCDYLVNKQYRATVS